MKTRQRAKLELSAADERLVTLGAAMKAGAAALFCALLTLIGLSVSGPEPTHDRRAATSTFVAPVGSAAADRIRLHEQRRARFEAERRESRTASAADGNRIAR